MELRAAVGRLIRSIRVTASAAAGISVGAITSESTANVSLSHVEMAGLGLLAPPSAAFTAAGGLAHQILSFAQERFVRTASGEVHHVLMPAALTSAAITQLRE